MNFGTNLRNLRMSRHITQQKLADDMSMSQASITAYEVGVREPPMDVIRKIAEYFHVSPSSLLPFDNASEDESAQKIADALHKNPKLKLLFNRTQYMDDNDLDAVLGVVNAISRERGDDT